MAEPNDRFRRVFFEVFEALPRQGPGNRASAARALALCHALPPTPSILDLGCGVGGQTLILAELTSSIITAIDNHAPFIARLRSTVAARGLEQRIRPLVADMAAPGLPPGGFDLIWSEGALYQLGIEPALLVCRDLLRPCGHLAFTDAVWRKANPPEEVRAGFESDYPTMGFVNDVLAIVARSGFELLGHFALPDEAWWDDFYTPMQRRLDELRRKYSGDAETLALLGRIAREPELHRLYGDYYAYEFFVLRRAIQS
ncbi:MAG TPA: class I SAM-dependent methyltransferase [Phycisphaerae bacterium]|nr:class I SAM-dependent methyltransferase [Phycisphaerae bacterium]